MICEQHCQKVSLVDQADDLEMSLFSGAATVGDYGRRIDAVVDN